MFSASSNASEVIPIPSSVNQQNFSSSPLNPPSCIVIGCKNGNGITNASVKYYQVPFIHAQQPNSPNPIPRQWYINTLREDLLDYVNSQQFNSRPMHYVCIEHFDEESFLIANAGHGVADGITVSSDSSANGQEMLMILKEDAVPSLFEIEVFQKMIAHQEQFALNQQRQLLGSQLKKQNTLPQSPIQQPSRSSLLSSLILNDNATCQNNSYINSNSSSKTISEMTSSSSSSSPVLHNKRTRIDPDVRAALIQRVPKAVKRTSVLGNGSLNLKKLIDSLGGAVFLFFCQRAYFQILGTFCI